jgi:phage tail-like protein
MDDPGYFYLNLDNAWPGFTLTGVSIRDNGALTLTPVNGSSGALGGGNPPLGALSGPAGIGVDGRGNLYLSDPAGNRILRWDVCTMASEPIPCVGGHGALPGQLNTPRGVIVGPRHALYVADSGNNRIQIFDLDTLSLRGIWGQPDPYGPPIAGALPGRFDDPWDLSADALGYVYVVDHGNHRIQKFDADGAVLPAFWDRVQTQAVVPQEPAYVATGLIGGSERLLVLDRGSGGVIVYTTDGDLDEAATQWWQDLGMEQPAGIVFAGGVLYVGDPLGERVLEFDASGALVGALTGYSGPVAGLALDRENHLLVHPGNGPAIRLLPGQGYAASGSFLAGPFTVLDRPVAWHRILALDDSLPATCHVQFFTYTTNSAAPPPAPPQPPVTADATPSTPVDTWRAAPRDALDLLVLNAPARHLWLAGALLGDGTSTPVLGQVRVEYDHAGWIRDLPALYQQPESGADFLRRSLALFETELGEDDTLIDHLPQLFDPAATPDAADRPWLPWLAGWLDFLLDDSWPVSQRREALAGAFTLYGQRGTIEGLRRLIVLYTGLTARIEEPGASASIWSLGAHGLGFDTMLAAGEAEGAVLGTTALVDRSTLGGAYGASLFEDVAHRFCVELYAAEITDPSLLDRVRAVLDREKPAETMYHIAVIGPAMRIGVQDRLAIDTILGGPEDLVLDDSRRLGLDFMLSPDSATGGAIGQSAQIGHTTLR